MGLFLAKLHETLMSFSSGGPPTRVLMLGLDAAGKTTILYKVNYIHKLIPNKLCWKPLILLPNKTEKQM